LLTPDCAKASSTAITEPKTTRKATVTLRPLWRARYFVNSASQAEYVQLSREAFDCLLNDLPLAA
jgi:hypothetical protein